MSKYTTELRFICEEQAGLTESVGYNDVADVIAEARPRIFSFDYPIFDPNYKPTLETKILKHFYTREIALETYGLWKLKLDAKMNEIMPYYNKMYESELIEFNPLYDTNIRTDGYKHNAGEEHGDEESGGTDVSTTGGSDVNRLSGSDVAANSGSDVDTLSGSDTGRLGGTDTKNKADKENTWTLHSDTPQGGVVGIANATDPSVASNAYLSDATHVIGDTAGSTESTNYGKTDTTTYGKVDTLQHGKTTTTNYGKVDTLNYGKTDTTDYGKTNHKDGEFENEHDYWETVAGYRGSNPSKSLIEFRNTFLNIDMMVIEELEELFFQLW